MTTTQEKQPKEYYVFRLGQQFADLRVCFEDAWNPFYPGDAFDPDSIGSQQKLPPVEFYDDLDLKVGAIRKTLEELTTREPKVKKAALAALELLDGAVYEVAEGLDEQRREEDPELKATTHKLLASLIKEKSVSIAGPTSVLLRPLIVDILGEVYENHRKQEEIIHAALKESTDVQEVPDTYKPVIAGELPIFDRPGWKRFRRSLHQTALAMGENCGVLFEVAIELELAHYHFHLDQKAPSHSWSLARQLQSVSERTKAAIAKLVKAGFDIDSVEMGSSNVPPGTAAEYATAGIANRLKAGGAFRRPIEVDPGSADGIFDKYSSVTWREVRIVITYQSSGPCIMNVGPAGDRDLPTVSQSAEDWGFAKRQDPRRMTKQWHCLVLFAAGGSQAQFVKESDEQIRVDLESLPETKREIGRQLQNQLPHTKEAMKKQMKDLGKRLSSLMTIEGNPISLKRNTPDNCALWTLACPISLVTEGTQPPIDP